MPGSGILNVGFSELFFLMIIAGIFLGPHRIRDVARWLGRITVQARNISRQFTDQLEAELDETEREELRGALSDIRSLQKEVANLKNEVLAGPRALINETNLLADDVKKDMDQIQQDVQDANKPNMNGNANRIGDAPVLPNVVDVEDDPII